MKLTLKEHCVRVWTGITDSGKGRRTVFCGRGTEPYDPIKDEEFLNRMSDYKLLNENCALRRYNWPTWRYCPF
jgi:hypothetical protein